MTMQLHSVGTKFHAQFRRHAKACAIRAGVEMLLTVLEEPKCSPYRGGLVTGPLAAQHAKGHTLLVGPALPGLLLF